MREKVFFLVLFWSVFLFILTWAFNKPSVPPPGGEAALVADVNNNVTTSQNFGIKNGNLYFGTTSPVIDASGAIQIINGMNVGGAVNFSGTVAASGNLSVDGDLFNVSAASLSITDSLRVNGSAAAAYVAIGNRNDAVGELRLHEDSDFGTNYVGFKAAITDLIGNFIWTLPTTLGNANDVLQTDGTGNLSWAAAGGGGGLTDEVIIKQAHQSNTSMANDNHLFFSTNPNSTTTFEITIFTSNTTGDLDVPFDVIAPAGSTCSYGVSSLSGSSPQTAFSCGADVVATIPNTGLSNCLGGSRMLTLNGVIRSGSTSGNVNLRWGSVGSGGIRVCRDSFMKVYKNIGQ